MWPEIRRYIVPPVSMLWTIGFLNGYRVQQDPKTLVLEKISNGALNGLFYVLLPFQSCSRLAGRLEIACTGRNPKDYADYYKEFIDQI